MSLAAQKENNTCLLISGRDGDMQQNHEIRTCIYTSDMSFIVTSILSTQSMITLYLANNIWVDRSYRGYIPFRKWRNKTHTQCVYSHSKENMLLVSIFLPEVSLIELRNPNYEGRLAMVGWDTSRKCSFGLGMDSARARHQSPEEKLLPRQHRLLLPSSL